MTAGHQITKHLTNKNGLRQLSLSTSLRSAILRRVGGMKSSAAFIAWLILTWMMLTPAAVNAQLTISGRVVDALTGEPLPFCNISLSANRRGSISDELGYFHFSGLAASDTLLFSYIGYLQATLPASRDTASYLQATLPAARDTAGYRIALQPARYSLAEVTILSDNSLFDLFASCREHLIRNYEQQQAKAYYKIATQSDHKPVELLEAYYNAHLTGEKIDYFDYKAGRAVLDTAEGNYWNSTNLSKLMASLNLCEASPALPLNPFCLRKAALKEAYSLKLLFADETSYQISFAPNSNESAYFKGMAWISKPGLQLLKVEMTVSQTKRHPLEPLIACDSIDSVTMNLTNTYDIQNGKSRLNTCFFNYNLIYESNRDTSCALYQKYHILPPYKKTVRPISSNVLIYLFDYQNTFILPYFDYPPDKVSDYLLMTVLPYNERFWKDNPSILSKDQKILMFGENEVSDILYRGHLQNGVNRLREELPALTRLNATQFNCWNRNKRLILRRSVPDSAGQSSEFGIRSSIRQCEIYAQILLDVDQIGDSIFTQSCTLLDSWRSYVLFQEDEYADVFINIYLDICEVERQRMQKELNSHNYTLTQIDSVYQLTVRNMNQLTARYLSEVDRGRQFESLNRWNTYIKNELGIDNLLLFSSQSKY